jgi:cobalt-zinc-cadmium efflux system outer membrane protein
MASRLTNRLAAIVCTVLLATTQPRQSTAQSQLMELAGASDSIPGPSVIPGLLTLPAALGLALRIHPDLRVARASLAVDRADSAFARVPAFNPEVEFLTSRGGRSLTSGTDGSLELGVSQELELWGKRAARQSVATARSRTGAAEFGARAQEITSEIRAQFERTLFLQDRLATLGEVTELDLRVVAATQARVRDGSMTPATGRLTELDALRLEAQSRRTRSDYRQALVALGFAIGLGLPESTRLLGELRADSLQTPEDSVVALAFRFRAQGEVLRRQIAERRAEFQLARRDGRPNITLGAGLARDRQAFSGDDFTGDPAIVRGITGARDRGNLWTARVSTPLPLWQKNQAGRARAAAEIVRSQADYDRYRLRNQLEVLGAVRRLQEAAGLYRLYLERSTRVRQDLALIREAYSDGRIPLDSYLTQKGRLVDTLLGQLEAGVGYWDARGQLETAVGLDLAHLNAEGAR